MNDPDHNLEAVRKVLRGEISELPPAPAAAVKLLELTGNEETEIAVVAHVIETEPALAAKVLQIVNSPFYGFSERIRSIRRAVTLLGFSSVRQTALHLLFYEGIIRHGTTGGGFDRLFYWQHCLLVAILSRHMGIQIDHPDPDSLYAAGLLHDLGKMILETHGSIGYSDFLAASSNSGNSSIQDEEIFFGVSHDIVGAAICSSWHLPEFILQTQSLHHRSLQGLEPVQAQGVAIISLADFIAWTQGLGSIRGHRPPALAPEVMEHVSMEQLDLDDLLVQADAEVTEIGSFYGLSFPSLPQLRARMVSTAIDLIQSRSPTPDIAPRPQKSITSHTTPHHSLDPDEFVPRTLEAIREEFGIARMLMMQIEPRRRMLVATHALPPLSGFPRAQNIELAIPSLSGQLVRCLRERRPMLIRPADLEPRIVEILDCPAPAMIPVMANGRLLGVLWLSGTEPATPLNMSLLPELQVVAGELGIALERSHTFAAERAKAEIDPLTRLPNRSAIDRVLQQAFDHGTLSDQRFAVGLVDIDRFKSFNDSFGHQTGDDVLRIIAAIMRSLTRPNDFLGRYGGEEFLFLLHVSNENGAMSYAERIRSEIEQRGHRLQQRFPGHVLTASIGVALNGPGLQSPAQIVAQADMALYHAKALGRNRVVSAWQTQPREPASQTPHP